MPLQQPGQIVEVTDGLGGPAAVKQFGAAAASTDNALVVTLSPGSSAVSGAATTKISDGTNTASIETAAGQPNSLAVATGGNAAVVTLNAVTTNATGATVDMGSFTNNVVWVAVGTSTLTGSLQLQGSLDNTAFVNVGSGVALTAAGTVTGNSVQVPFRYWRVNLSGAAGSGSATAKLGGAD